VDLAGGVFLGRTADEDRIKSLDLSVYKLSLSRTSVFWRRPGFISFRDLLGCGMVSFHLCRQSRLAWMIGSI
jgi:hypothetical protein